MLGQGSWSPRWRFLTVMAFPGHQLSFVAFLLRVPEEVGVSALGLAVALVAIVEAISLLPALNCLYL